MIKIIPAINVDSFEEVKRRIKLVEPYIDPAAGGAGWIQLDISDGTFTKNTVWHNAKDLLNFKTSLKIEVHLMINDIEDRLEEWFIAPVKRIIFHLETAKNPDFILEKCKKEGKEVGIAIGPDTAWTRLLPYLTKVDLIQILGVQPGLSGQKFQEECFDKITHIRKECKRCVIEVDGGMDKEAAKKAVAAGANIINAATAIFGAKDIKKAIEKLRNA